MKPRSVSASAVLLSSLTAFSSSAQDLMGASDIVPCIYSFSSEPAPAELSVENIEDDVAHDYLEAILKELKLAISITRPIELRRSSYLSGACASRDKVKSNQVVFYNMRWLKKLIANGDEWVIAFALAHELGHHFNDHTAYGDDLGGHKMELEADRFAGRMIYLLGGDIDQAVSIFDSHSYEPTLTHPARPVRVAAARMGFGQDESIRERIPSIDTLLSREHATGDRNELTPDDQANVQLLFSDNRDERLFAFSNLAASSSDSPQALKYMTSVAAQNSENENGVYNVLAFLNTQATPSALGESWEEIAPLLTSTDVLDNGIRTQALAAEVLSRNALADGQHAPGDILLAPWQ